MRRLPLACLPLVLVAAPVLAQHHDRAMPEQPPAEEEQVQPAEDHSQMDHGSMDHASMDHGAMDHGAMDHGAPPEEPKPDTPQEMDHAAMGHGSVDASAPIPQGPPPPEAYSGPKHAADAQVGAAKMAASRASVVREVSGMPVFWFQADRLEYRARKAADGYLWDVQGFYGGDIDKLWFKSEGEGAFGEKPEHAEAQALWSHAVGPWWDLQAGVRQDLAGPSRTHLAVGLQGLAPYLFEVDAAAFLSDKGDITARIEAELDQRITQRLILQPRVELDFAAQDVPELGIGAGLDKAELGLRLRYEIVREFAPYIGIDQEWKAGKSADYARAAGESPSTTNFVVGVRFWF